MTSGIDHPSAWLATSEHQAILQACHLIKSHSSRCKIDALEEVWLAPWSHKAGLVTS